MDTGLFFTHRFDLSKKVGQYSDKNSAHYIGGQFRSFWVSATSKGFQSARILFNPHKGSEAGQPVSLRLNMSANLPYMVQTACIEVPFNQEGQWIEITFSVVENFTVGSVAVQLESAPPVTPVIDFGGISISNDERFLALDIYTMETIASAGTVSAATQKANRKIKDPIDSRYKVPFGYTFKPIGAKITYYVKPANSRLSLLCASNGTWDSSGMFGSFATEVSGDVIPYATAIVIASPKRQTVAFSIEDANSGVIEKTFFDEGESIFFKLFSNSDAGTAAYNFSATVFGLLERKTA